LRELILKILNTKSAGGVTQGIGPEFKPQNCKINKEINKIEE
jgi:hypothetical protein